MEEKNIFSIDIEKQMYRDMLMAGAYKVLDEVIKNTSNLTHEESSIEIAKSISAYIKNLEIKNA